MIAMLDHNIEESMSEPQAPVLRQHHAYRSWTSSWWDESKHRRTKRFGREGKVTRQQAHARFKNWKATKYDKRRHVRDLDSAQYKCSDLATEFLEHARKTYVKDGDETSHVWSVAYAMDSLNKLYGHLPAAAVEAPMLVRLRDAMIWTTDASGAAKRRAMKTVNNRLFCIKQAFTWARMLGLVPAETLVDVLAVPPLAKGRSDAKDPKPVRPVEETMMRDAQAHCSPTVRAMIDVQWLTGMRPEEVCAMRTCDLDRAGPVWVYTPSSHKMQHKGQTRLIPIGKRCQKILAPFLTRALTAHLFSPAESVAHFRAERRKARKTPASCGNTPGTNRKETPLIAPRDHFDTGSYRKSIRLACRKAGIKPAWTPNQLRHSWGTRVRQQFGIEMASAGLGHLNLSTTEIYAERSLRDAIDVAKKIG